MRNLPDTAPADPAKALSAEGAAVREYIKSNRSPTLLGLFDYLLEQTLQGHRPKEFEIAEVVFHESIDGAGGQGSRVRVGVHRLRKKLESYYEGTSGPRIIIPQGEYALQLVTRADPQEAEERQEAAAQRSRLGGRLSLWIAALVLVLGNVAMAGVYFSDRLGFGYQNVRATLWRGFGPDQPTTIVAGDYFMFLSKGETGEFDEVSQDLSINNPDDFYHRMSIDPTFRHKLMPGNSYSVSTESLGAISALWPVIQAFNPLPMTSSQVSAETMKTSSIIYVGAIDAISPLIGSPLFQASHFRCAETCYELVNKANGQRYLSASPFLLGDQIIPRRDYGYIASFPGPAGKQIIVISGTGEAGVMQMANLATGDPARLRELGKKIGGKFGSFEALYQVRTMFSQSYHSTLLEAYPIDMSKVWDKTRPLGQLSAPSPGRQGTF